MQADNTTGARTDERRTMWDRERAASLLAKCEKASDGGISERAFAERHEVARTTLRSWRERKAGLDTEPALVGFFDSQEGLAFIHRLLSLVHLIFCQAGPCGVDRVSLLLRLSGLSAFVGSSHGTQHTMSVAMSREIKAFGQAQRAKLAPGMREREIMIGADETWLTEMCLVGMEPRSNFILAEEYAASRDGETWQTVVEESVEGLPVKIVGVAADEGSGLGRMIETLLGVQKAPDVLHVKRDLWKALGQANRHSVKAPAKALEVAEAHQESWRDRFARHQAGDRPVGRPPDFERHIAAAEAAHAEALAEHARVANDAESVEDAIRTLSSAYHPVDLATGALRDVGCVRSAFEQAVTTIDLARAISF